MAAGLRTMVSRGPSSWCDRSFRIAWAVDLAKVRPVADRPHEFLENGHRLLRRRRRSLLHVGGATVGKDERRRAEDAVLLPSLGVVSTDFGQESAIAQIAAEPLHV